MGFLGSALKWIVAVPLVLAALFLGIANDQAVTIRLNPFDPADPVLSFELLVYQLVFLVFALGVVAGGLIAWAGQRKYRRRAFERGEAAKIWQYRAEKAESGPGGAPVPARPGR